MCTINFYGSIDITIGGQSFGLTCDWGHGVNCGGPEGTYTVYYLNGSIGVCPPGSEDACGLNQNYPHVQYTKVFCDPCLNRCNTDGNVLKYIGDQHWMFTTYVNGSPSPTPLVLDTFTVNIADGDIRFKNVKMSGGDQECCCWDGVILDTYLEPKQIPLESLIQANSQPYIGTEGDPNLACNCGCPGYCGPVVAGCGIDEIFAIWRESESQRCGPA